MVSIMFVFIHLQNTAIPKQFFAYDTYIGSPLVCSLAAERFIKHFRYVVSL